MALFLLVALVIFLPGWFFIGLVGGLGCTDKAPWCEKAQAGWLVASSLIALLST